MTASISRDSRSSTVIFRCPPLQATTAPFTITYTTTSCTPVLMAPGLTVGSGHAVNHELCSAGSCLTLILIRPASLSRHSRLISRLFIVICGFGWPVTFVVFPFAVPCLCLRRTCWLHRSSRSPSSRHVCDRAAEGQTKSKAKADERIDWPVCRLGEHPPRCRGNLGRELSDIRDVGSRRPRDFCSLAFRFGGIFCP
jgi:hypothetical protein